MKRKISEMKEISNITRENPPIIKIAEDKYKMLIEEINYNEEYKKMNKLNDLNTNLKSNILSFLNFEEIHNHLPFQKGNIFTNIQIKHLLKTNKDLLEFYRNRNKLRTNENKKISANLFDIIILKKILLNTNILKNKLSDAQFQNLIRKNPNLMFNLRTNIYIPLFPLYTDGGLFSIYEGTDGYHCEYYENCISNIFSVKNTKPFFLVDFRDVNTLSAVYYKLTAEDYYLRLKNFNFKSLGFIKKYMEQYKKFFDLYFNKTTEKFIHEITFANSNEFDYLSKNFNHFDYFLFLFHNNIGPLYNDNEVFLDEDNFFGNEMNNKNDSFDSSEKQNIVEAESENNGQYIDGIEVYKQVKEVNYEENKNDKDNKKEFLESLSIEDYQKNSLCFILKKLHFVSLKKGVKFILFVSDDFGFIEKQKCKEKMKKLYEEYHELFTQYSDKEYTRLKTNNRDYKSKVLFDKNDIIFDAFESTYTNKLKFKNLPEKEYDLSFEKLKMNNDLVLRSKEDQAVKYLEFNLSNELFIGKALKPLILIEILSDCDFYALDVMQNCISRFINILEIRGINPYNPELKNINYDEPLDTLIESGVWINSWKLHTIPKIIPFGSLVDL